jgi:copper chaperone
VGTTLPDSLKTPQPLQKGCGVLLCLLHAAGFANDAAFCFGPQEKTMLTFSIPAISCGHCARAITDTIHELDPAAVVQVDVTTRTVTVDTGADAAIVRERLAAEGYPATPL